MNPANNHAPMKKSITCGLQNFCRHLAFPSNCHLILMVDYSFLMASCKTCWVKNSFLMVNYSSLMANYTTGLGKNSSTVDYSFSMANCMNGWAKSF